MNNDKTPSRTDCARWLNLNGETFKGLRTKWKVYQVMCTRGGRTKRENFGFWLRENYPINFNHVFTWFQKHPELLEMLYASDNSP